MNDAKFKIKPELKTRILIGLVLTSCVRLAVSIKHGLRTTDYGLGIKHGLRYKTRTKHFGLGIKYGLGYKTRTEHYGLGIKHEETK